MRLRPRLLCACWMLLLAVSSARLAAAPYTQVTVETSSTSIYIGNVTLHVAPLARNGDSYTGEYRAKVFPYFFMGERGTLRIDISDADLARAAQGETVEFTGHAANSDGEARRITGRATPSDAAQGKLKVRIWVSEKIQLIFNTSYRFGA